MEIKHELFTGLKPIASREVENHEPSAYRNIASHNGVRTETTTTNTFSVSVYGPRRKGTSLPGRVIAPVETGVVFFTIPEDPHANVTVMLRRTETQIDTENHDLDALEIIVAGALNLYQEITGKPMILPERNEAKPV